MTSRVDYGAMTRRRELDWRTRAACIGQDPELFFPVSEKGPCALQTQEALAVCAGCPALRECREWSLATRQPHGISGGLTEAERVALLAGSKNERRALRRS